MARLTRRRREKRGGYTVERKRTLEGRIVLLFDGQVVERFTPWRDARDADNRVFWVDGRGHAFPCLLRAVKDAVRGHKEECIKMTKERRVRYEAWEAWLKGGFNE